MLTKPLSVTKFVYFRDKLGMVENASLLRESVEFCSIVRHSPSDGQWENAWPLSGIRVNLVRDQMDLVKDEVVLVQD